MLMKLIYTNDGEEVSIGDMIDIRGIKHQIVDLTPPHKPSASGHVYVKRLADLDSDFSNKYYVGVIGAEWINREDQE
jgi:hypothetical protein